MADEQFHDYDDLAPQTFKFKHAGVNYILREPTEAATQEMRTVHLRNRRISDDPKASPSSMVDPETVLVCRSLVVADSDWKPRTVQVQNSERYVEQVPPEQNVRCWPNRVLQDLQKRALTMADLLPKDTIADLQKQVDDLTTKVGTRLDSLNAAMVQLKAKAAEASLAGAPKAGDPPSPVPNSLSATAPTSA